MDLVPIEDLAGITLVSSGAFWGPTVIPVSRYLTLSRSLTVVTSKAEVYIVTSPNPKKS